MPDLELAPIQITLYGANDEALNTYSRTRVSTELLLQAIELAEKLEKVDTSAGNVGAKEARTVLEALGAFVVEVFSNQFTLSDVMKGSDNQEMASVLTAVVTRAKGISTANPTFRPARKNHPKRK